MSHLCQKNTMKEGTYDCLRLTCTSLSWQKVGADLFELKETKYLLVVDYFSHYVEIAKLTSTCSGVVIGHLKTIYFSVWHSRNCGL